MNLLIIVAVVFLSIGFYTGYKAYNATNDEVGYTYISISLPTLIVGLLSAFIELFTYLYIMSY